MAALRAVTEVAVHIGHFRNVDLFQQGLYRLQCRVVPGPQAVPAAATPHVVQAEVDAGTAGVLPAGADAERGLFWTRTILIRFSEEEAAFNDIARFRLEHDAAGEWPVALEVQLMFLDMSVYPLVRLAGLCGGQAPQQAGATPGGVDFRALSTQTLVLHGVTRGLHAFFPVEFDEQNFCQAGLMVHTSLLDFRFRLRPPDAEAGSALPTLAEALVELAGRTSEGSSSGSSCSSTATPPPRGGRGGKQLRPGAESSLARAADCLQCEYVSRLAAAHAELVAFLEQMDGTQAFSASLSSVLPLILPGHGELSPVSRASAREVLADAPVPLSSRLAGASAAQAARLLVEDLSFVSAQVAEAWQCLLEALPATLRDVTDLLQASWEQCAVKRWNECIFREVCPTSEFAAPRDPEIWSTHARTASALRQSQRRRNSKPHTIEELPVPAVQPIHPILFEQRYIADDLVGDADLRGLKPAAPFRLRDACSAPAYEGVHVIVLVHGFQGNSFDMRLVRNMISLFYPHALYLCSSANEEDTEGDISQMGANLAAEVRAFLRFVHVGDDSPQPERLGRLSFVTHSVGGLIVRSALPLLTGDFGEKLFTFLSFSSPHLGYVYPSTALFGAGLWVAKKVRQSKCLEQLSMTDSPDPEATFLNRLAKTPGLEHFQHIGLASSYQDQYAPFESARIEMSSSAAGDPKHGPLYERMVWSVLGPLKPERVIRFDFNFQIPEKSLDTMIGRAAHIKFIENQSLIQMFVMTHGYLFE